MTMPPIDDLQWEQALAIARQSCAAVFRDGGTPGDAMAVFGLKVEPSDGHSDWSRVVESIALLYCQSQDRHAA